MIDIIIAGGGASGIMAAISAKMQNPSLSVTVLEGQNRPLKKLLATGNGRCNMINLNPQKENFYGENSCLAMEIIKKADPSFILNLFSELGLCVTNRHAPLIYPASMQASSVREALLTACYERGVKIFSDFEITDISPCGSGFDVVNKKGKTLTCRKLILAGGTSAGGAKTKMPQLLKSLGHKIQPFYPALVPLNVKNTEALKLSDGARAYAKLKLLCDGKVIKEDSGEVQFCSYGLSGIVTMQISGHAIKLINQGKNPEISVSLYDNADEILKRLLADKTDFKKISIYQRLCFILNSSVSKMILKTAKINEDALLSELSDDDIKRAVKLLECMKFYPVSEKGAEFAQVFGGGAALDEFDSNLCSKINPDLYAAGEILDIYGDCGGYNLTWAWASGYVCGYDAAQKLTTN